MSLKMVSNLTITGLYESIVDSGYSFMTNHQIENKDYTCTDKDIKRAKSLGNLPSSSGEDNFLTGIISQFDLTCTNKMWVEAERYHFFQIVTSQSTMHRLSKSNLEDAYIQYVDPRIIVVMKELQDKYNSNPTIENFYNMVYSNPSGCLITARVSTNYRQLKTIYQQRHNHKLKEWQDFCSILKNEFTMFDELCLSGNTLKKVK